MVRISRLLVAAALASGSTAAMAFAPYQTGAAAKFHGTNGWTVKPLVTVGETLPNSYNPIGVFDGIGGYRLNDTTVRLLINSEVGRSTSAYSLANGTSLTGSRVQYFDIDRTSRKVINAGVAFDKIVDRAGNAVTDPTQVNAGFERFCSSELIEGNAYGAGRGVQNRIYLTGEENGNGTMYALDPSTRTLHAVPALGKASFENAVQVDTGTTNKVGFLIGDDTAGAPQFLYVGTKNAAGDFLDQNGLKTGTLYAWKADNGDLTPQQFGGGNGDSRTGTWVALTVRDPSKAGMAGYDAEGYASSPTLQAEADAKGAFSFARPEDLANNPSNPNLVAFNATGNDAFAGGADTWGTVYTSKLTFDADGNPVGNTVTVVYNGNLDASRALRSPDNVDWKDATTLLVQEDRAANWELGPNLADGGILEVGLDGTVSDIGRLFRAVEAGQVDALPAIGEWETSGITDISNLFGLALGSLFAGDVQAHGIRFPGTLQEGAQLFLLGAPGTNAVPEPAAWTLMIGGFGLVGATMRRRGRMAAVVG